MHGALVTHPSIVACGRASSISRELPSLAIVPARKQLESRDDKINGSLDRWRQRDKTKSHARWNASLGQAFLSAGAFNSPLYLTVGILSRALSGPIADVCCSIFLMVILVHDVDGSEQEDLAKAQHP